MSAYNRYNRRDFLATSSVALAGAAVLGFRSRPLGAQALRSRLPVATLLPDIVDPATLRQLALGAMDAAKSAGASFADIRIANRRMFQMTYWIPTQPPQSSIGFDYSYGIRVRVDGGWAFGYGADPTPEGVAETVRGAVATARGLAKVSGGSDEFAAAPVVTGEWATPIKIDPFSISPDEHAYMLGAYMSAAMRIPDGGTGPAGFYWLAETRVFASSEGSIITQHLAQARPRVILAKSPPVGMGGRLEVTELAPAGAGYEIALGTTLQDKIKEATEEAARLASYPEANVDVGRYEAVLDGTSVGAALGATLLPALELDRVLGQTANAGGTSFLAPPEKILGLPMFSAALTVTADRALPHLGAAKWDDEGVETEAFPVVHQGAIVDYFATRSTAPALASWYAKNGKSSDKLHGSAVSWLPTRAPIGSASHLTVSSGASGVTLDALTKQLVNGVLVRGVTYAHSDQQLTSGAFYPYMLYEVKKGQITRRLRHGAVQFSTKKFWKSVTAFGDASSVQSYIRNGANGQPWVPTIQPIMAPAAHFQELNVTAREDRAI
jgi:TldD protein